MSSTSSSDSEDTSKYHEACDPILSIVYDNSKSNIGSKHSKSYSDSLHEETKCESSIELEDPRETFRLLHKLRQVQGGRQSTFGVKSVSSNFGAVHQRKSQTDGLMCCQSTPYSYIAKQLDAMLETSLEIKKTHHEEETKSHDLCKEKQDFFLLKNVKIRALNSVHGSETKQKKKEILRSSYFNSSDEEEVISTCQSLALPPERILNKEDDIPWPHPKNIRYLDEYRLQEKKNDGTLLIVPINVHHKDVNMERLKLKKSKLAKCLPNKSKEFFANADIKNKRTVVEKKFIKNNLNCSISGKECSGSIEKRKQTRKRGKKKKNEVAATQLSRLYEIESV